VSGTVDALLAAGDIWAALGGNEISKSGVRPYSIFNASCDLFDGCSKSNERFSSSLCAVTMKNNFNFIAS
jgi:hypothetical protein